MIVESFSMKGSKPKTKLSAESDINLVIRLGYCWLTKVKPESVTIKCFSATVYNWYSYFKETVAYNLREDMLSKYYCRNRRK